MVHLRFGFFSCLLAATSTLVVLSLPSCAPNEPVDADTSRPHILLVSIDTLAARHLSSYGYHRHTSPFLDRLAAEGTRFSHAYANTHGTPPSHATLLTSLYQETHRVSFPGRGGTEPTHVLSDSLRLLPERLQETGYTTLAVTGSGFVSEKFGFDQGFDSFRAPPRNIRKGANILIREIRHALRRGKPVFAFFHTYETHSPYLPPGRYRKTFGSYRSSFVPKSANLQAIQNDAGRLSEDDLLAVEASYDAGIRYADDELRRLFERLEELSFLERTLVVVLSDHGEEFGEHGGLLHGLSLYDEILHVPLILWGEDVPRAVVDTRLVSLVDVAPTILAGARIPVPESMEGTNLLAETEEVPAREAVFAQYADLLYGIRTARWKLIEDTRKRSFELYDLRVDPGERNDLAEIRPEVATALAAQLDEWRASLPVLGDLESPSPHLDSAEIEKLRSLGYID